MVGHAGWVRLFSYVVASDSGFAPNPFWGSCTLATCKPAIRRTARVGDWVAGLSPKASGNRLVYAMRVAEVMPIDSYFADPRFQVKKPDPSGGRVRARGDNIYAPGPVPGQLRQLPSLHSRIDGGEDLAHARRDLGGLNVLVSDEFWYFGGSGPPLPDHLSVLIGGRGHKNRFPPDVVEEFLAFLQAFPAGVTGKPTRWPADDQSWRGVQS